MKINKITYLLLIFILIVNLTSCRSSKTLDEYKYETSNTNLSEVTQCGGLSETSTLLQDKNSQILTDEEIILLFEKAQKLYAVSDGLSSENYILKDGEFYLNGDTNSININTRIKKYTEVFSNNECIEIFNGKRNSNGIEYMIQSYGTTNAGEIKILSAKEILNSEFSKFNSVTLFTIVRGENFSYAAGYVEITEINLEKINIKYTALYLGNHNDNIEYEIKCENKKWIVASSAGVYSSGDIYSLQENDYIKEYTYQLIFENGMWKFDNFELWY